jgi:hypothetical protein
VDKILRVVDSHPPTDVADRARRLLELALGDRDDQLRVALFDLVSRWPVPVTTPGHDPEFDLVARWPVPVAAPVEEPGLAAIMIERAVRERQRRRAQAAPVGGPDDGGSRGDVLTATR